MVKGFRRQRTALALHQVAEIVRRREAGETWMSIGRDFGKQDGQVKRVYDTAKARPTDMAVAA